MVKDKGIGKSSVPATKGLGGPSETDELEQDSDMSTEVDHTQGVLNPGLTEVHPDPNTLDAGASTSSNVAFENDLNGLRTLQMDSIQQGGSREVSANGRSDLSDRVRGPPQSRPPFCTADFRRNIREVLDEIVRVKPSSWRQARNEFHVRLADIEGAMQEEGYGGVDCLLYTSPSPRDS